MSIQLPDPQPTNTHRPPELLLINPTAVPLPFNIVLTGGTTLLDSAGIPVLHPIVNQMETNRFTIIGSPAGISLSPIPDGTYWMIY